MSGCGRILAFVLTPLVLVSHWLEAQGPERDNWRYSFTPYVWMTGLEGTIGVGSNITDVDVSFTEGAEDFDFGFAGLFEGRRHLWSFRLDFYYVALSDEGTIPAGGTLTAGQDELMVHPEVGYTLFSRPWGGLDGLIGARYRSMGVDIGAPQQEVSADRSWVDGTLGANFRYQPAEKWRLAAKADAGAGGSDFTWQLYAGAGYALGGCCSLVAAWRAVGVDYEKEGLVYDVRMSGPTFGLTLRF